MTNIEDQERRTMNIHIQILAFQAGGRGFESRFPLSF